MDDDGDDKDDSKRRNRNLSEKKRRDQFNMLVNELSIMVSTNSRKMDKSTVLKATISFLKNHNDIKARSRAHDVHGDWKPTFLTNEEFTYLVLEALEGFVMVFSAIGRVHYVSESVASLLGHNPTDIINQSIFDLAHEDDRPQLYGLLQSVDPMQSMHFKGREINFQCHLRRGTLDFRDGPTYELVQFYGHFRTSMDPMESEERSSCFQRDSESRILFACIGRLQTPHLIRDVSLVDTTRNEFTSRHSLEWKFLYLDHRAPPIIGYLPFEVLGTSGYDYYHFDDIEKVVTCHEELMEKGELTSCYYRFLTKGQQWIWLQTRFYISYHQWNSKPEFVVCSHRVVSYEDVTNTVKKERLEPNQPAEEPSDHLMAVPAEDARAAATSPSCISEVSETFGSYQRHSQLGEPQRWPQEATSNHLVVGTPNDSASVAALSPSCMSETSDAFGTYQHHSQTPSVKSVSSAGGTVATMGTAPRTPPWGRQFETRQGSDNGSQSGESRVSRSREVQKEEKPTLAPQQTLAPQRSIGAQYLEAAPYVGVPGVMPVLLPTLLLPEQQVQYMDEQLHRKHEELQQMIVRQQAELRRVKEQLLMARLGILPPLVNVPSPYMNTEEMNPDGHMVPQIIYEAHPQPRPALAEFPAQHPQNPHMPQ